MNGNVPGRKDKKRDAPEPGNQDEALDEAIDESFPASDPPSQTAPPKHRKEKIHKHGHMHLDDYLERRDQFKNERVIVGHFSTRYHDRQIRHYIEKAMPDFLDGRLHLWL